MTDELQLQMNEYLPLRDVVFQTLRQAILQGYLQPGERLMEIHLAQKLGVSRTPVREAIRMLELEGLVIMVPRKGAIVAEITVSDLEDVLEVREALEELAVKKACQNMNEEQLERLKQAAKRFSDSLEKDLLASAQADVEFHEIICEATQNKRLVQILNNIREQIYRYRLENLKDRSSHANLVEEHTAICRALEERSEEKASEAIRIHIEHQKSSIIGSLSIKQELQEDK
ncbi:MAG: GntR family transcriptional regulator [Lachnospiraceae bacterium]|nr:GntR family transcriptional regulator [Lachnospiraceae bacterium]